MPSSLLDPVTTTPAPAAAPAAPCRPGLRALPEVRWAAAATALFAAGLAAHFGPGPGWLAWALFLACYAAGGWEPGRAGLRPPREKSRGTRPGGTRRGCAGCAARSPGSC